MSDINLTLTIDTTAAHKALDELLAKAEQVGAALAALGAPAPATITHNVVITASGKGLAGVLQMEQDRLGRVRGRNEAPTYYRVFYRHPEDPGYLDVQADDADTAAQKARAQKPGIDVYRSAPI